MKYRASQQFVRDYEKLLERIKENGTERAAAEQRAADEQKKHDDTLSEIANLSTRQTEVSASIDRLNRELTEAHSRRRALQDEEARLADRVRTHAMDRDRIRAVEVASFERRGADLQAKLEKMERDLPAAKERLERVEQRKKEQAAEGEPGAEKVVKVVHVGLDGKPWGLVQKDGKMPFRVIQKRGLGGG